MAEAHRQRVQVQFFLFPGLSVFVHVNVLVLVLVDVLEISPVLLIPHDRQSRRRQVRPHLVRSARGQPHAHQRRRRPPLDHLPGRLGGLRLPAAARRGPARRGGRRGRSARSPARRPPARRPPRPGRSSRSRRRSARRAARARPAALRAAISTPLVPVSRRWTRPPSRGSGDAPAHSGKRATMALAAVPTLPGRQRMRGHARRLGDRDQRLVLVQHRHDSPRVGRDGPPRRRIRASQRVVVDVDRRARLVRGQLGALARPAAVDAHGARLQQPSRRGDAQPRHGGGDDVIDSLTRRIGRDARARHGQRPPATSSWRRSCRRAGPRPCPVCRTCRPWRPTSYRSWRPVLVSVFATGFVSVLATAVAGFFFTAASGRCAAAGAARSGRFLPGVIPIVRSWGASPVGE